MRLSRTRISALGTPLPAAVRPQVSIDRLCFDHRNREITADNNPCLVALNRVELVFVGPVDFFGHFSVGQKYACPTSGLSPLGSRLYLLGSALILVPF